MKNDIIYVVSAHNYIYRAFSNKLDADKFTLKVERELGLSGYNDNRVKVTELKIDDKI